MTDNGSVDDTPEILGRWADRGLARVIYEPGNDMADNGHEWVTRMAREAATEHGADWVIHADADEFWWPLEGTLKEARWRRFRRSYGVVLSPRVEFLARPDGPGEFYDRLTIRESRALLRPKVAHRGIPDALVLHRGQHEVTVGGDLSDAWDARSPTGPRGASHRARQEGGEGVRRAPDLGARVLHPHAALPAALLRALPAPRRAGPGRLLDGHSRACATG